MRIELYRHGMTEGNKVGRYVGQRDEPLCEEGIAELSCLDADERIVYTSPRIRCVQTARILFPNAHVERVADLDEMSFGAFEGRTWREMQEDPVFREWIDGDCVGRCPGGEDQAEHHARVALTQWRAACAEPPIGAGSVRADCG